jgi:hypothetical protein
LNQYQLGRERESFNGPKWLAKAPQMLRTFCRRIDVRLESLTYGRKNIFGSALKTAIFGHFGCAELVVINGFTTRTFP